MVWAVCAQTPFISARASYSRLSRWDLKRWKGSPFVGMNSYGSIEISNMNFLNLFENISLGRHDGHQIGNMTWSLSSRWHLPRNMLGLMQAYSYHPLQPRNKTIKKARTRVNFVEKIEQESSRDTCPANYHICAAALGLFFVLYTLAALDSIWSWVAFPLRCQ